MTAETPMTAESHRDVECPHVVRLPVLGVLTTFATNAPSVCDAIHAFYGEWAELDARPGLVSPSNATVRIVVHDRPDATDSPSAFSQRMPDPTRFVTFWDGGVGVADTRRMESLAYVSAELVSRRTEFCAGVLEPLTLFLLTALDRQPVHAAAVARRGAAVMLAGRSGIGKSTLSYAAHRHGYSVLADEPVYVQLRPMLRVWGRRPRLHLRVDARAHFPELNDIAPVRLPGGKTKLPVDAGDRDRRYAERVGICLLRRGGRGRPSLERVPVEDVVAELTADLDPGYERFSESIGDRLAAIAGRGAWRLEIAGAPQEAVPLLDRIAADLQAAG
ncbi:MAG: hypothetical protein ACODAE_01300 [Gemmatimonadota bacterium]